MEATATMATAGDGAVAGSGCGGGGLEADARSAVGFEDEPFRRHVADRRPRGDLVRVEVRFRVRVRVKRLG